MSIVLGIDVSSHQGQIDWTKVAPTLYDFALARMTIGRSTRDDRGRANLKAMLGIMPIAGMYGVVGTSEPVTDGAKLLVDEVAACGVDPRSILIMLDAENFGDGSHPTLAQINRYAIQLRTELGAWPAAYVPDWFLDQLARGGDGDGTVRGLELANCRWVPSEYIGPPWTEDRISSKRPTNLRGFAGLDWHQFTSSGTVPGISGRVDLNAFYGTLAELRAQLLGQEGPMLDQPDKDWLVKQFTAGAEGVTVRTAIWELAVRAVNSVLGSGTSRGAIDQVAIGDGSPARKGIADVVGGLPVELDVTKLTADQLLLISQGVASALVVEGVEVRDGKLIVTMAAK